MKVKKSKIRDLIRSITKIYEKKIDSDCSLPLNKTIEIPAVTIIVRAVFHENNKYYPQVFFR